MLCEFDTSPNLPFAAGVISVVKSVAGLDRHSDGAADVHRNLVPIPAHLYRLAQAGPNAGICSATCGE